MYNSHKYSPGLVKIVPWEKLEEKYENLGFPYESMFASIRFIRKGNLDKKLFAYTSMHNLIVTIYNPAEFNREALHITLNVNNMRWCFEYRPKPFEPSEMIRYCDDNELIVTFYKYINRLKW